MTPLQTPVPVHSDTSYRELKKSYTSALRSLKNEALERNAMASKVAALEVELSKRAVKQAEIEQESEDWYCSYRTTVRWLQLACIVIAILGTSVVVLATQV